MKLNFCVPSLFGLEGLVADELRRLGLEHVNAENGRVLFTGTEFDLARANINLSTGERVLIVVGSSKADTFDELFEAVRAMPWEQYIPKNGVFPIKGHSLGSKLHSIPDCQKIVKKAIVERLKYTYNIQWCEESSEAKYQVQFAIMNDKASLYIDTSGAGLHKRGYRPVGNAAPLRETLAAAIVKLARYRGKEIVADLFCGSGTILIEAAFAALNRAPGLHRSFEAQNWQNIDRSIWQKAFEEAKSKEYSGSYDIWGGDIDPGSINIAKACSKLAGVSEHIRFEVSEAADFARSENGGIIMTNPPYGERVMLKKEAEQTYKHLGIAHRRLSDWKAYVLSSHAEFEREFGKTAKKKRKLYNGMIKCNLYMYY